MSVKRATATDADLEERFARLVAFVISPTATLAKISRLSGGASQETWQLLIRDGEDQRSLVLRRALNGTLDSRAHGPGLASEAMLMNAASRRGVPVPNVLHVLRPEDGLGTGFLMPKVEGETIARKILRDDRFAPLRPKLAGRCGEILAQIHSIETDACPPLWKGGAAEQLEQLVRQYRAQDEPRPVFEVTFAWLDKNVPVASNKRCLVHGDFRNGNLIVDEQDVRAVLDWELAHLGDPIEDLGWLCVPSWRFGNVDKPAGGFGSIDALVDGYERGGGVTVDRSRLHFWTLFGTLFWGVTCVQFALDFLRGDRSVERAAIGRRVSETEIDLLMLLGIGGGK